MCGGGQTAEHPGFTLTARSLALANQLKESIMSKGQRGNKEAKKPKKPPEPKPVTAGGQAARLADTVATAPLKK